MKLDKAVCNFILRRENLLKVQYVNTAEEGNVATFVAFKEGQDLYLGVAVRNKKDTHKKSLSLLYAIENAYISHNRDPRALKNHLNMLKSKKVTDPAFCEMIMSNKPSRDIFMAVNIESSNMNKKQKYVDLCTLFTLFTMNLSKQLFKNMQEEYIYCESSNYYEAIIKNECVRLAFENMNITLPKLVTQEVDDYDDDDKDGYMFLDLETAEISRS